MKQRFNRFIEYVSLSWVNQYINNIREYKTVPNENDDIFEMNLYKPFSGNLYLRDNVLEFQNNILFKYQYKLTENGKNSKIGKKLIEMFWNEFVFCLFLKALIIFLEVRLNITLKNFMQVVNLSNKLIQCLFLLCLQTFKIYIDTHTNFLVAKMSLKIQTFIIRLAYEDLTGINSTLTKQTKKDKLNNTPNIHNVIFGDLNSLEALMQSLIELIISPIKIIGVWMLLTSHIGLFANSSIFTFILLHFMGLAFQIVGSLYKRKFMNLRDIRISKCHEYFSSLPTIRQLFWEEIVYEDLMSIRKKEVKANLTKFLYLMSGTFLEYNSLSIAKYVLFSSFIYESYTQLSDSSSFETIITSRITTLHALNMLTNPTRNIASNIVEGVISFKRVINFFERNTSNSLNNKMVVENQANLIGKEKYIYRIDFEKINRHDSELFSFEFTNPLNSENSETSCLIKMPYSDNSKLGLNISHFKLKINELYILSGKSGSGKTLLINHILDQFYSTRDQCISIFHSSQNFWFPKGTVRSAILFGKEYDQINYEKVIKTCSLDVDISMWKDGDLRQLDESDQTLSNGQKSRINLARTLYYLLFIQKTGKQENNKIMIILDDLFSTLDIQTSVEIFENLFKENSGLISNISCIVTIGIDKILKLTSKVKFSSRKSVKVVIMDKGSISYYGLLQNYLEEFPSRKNNSSHLNDGLNSDNGYKEYEKKNDRTEELNNEIIINNERLMNKKNKEILESQMIKDCFYSKYIYYFEYIGSVYIFIFLFLCILKIGITKSIDIYLANFLSFKSQKNFINYYKILLIIKLFIDFFAFISEAILSAKSSSKIHNNYLISLLKAPLSFYSFTPISKVLNRFNLDLLVLDDILVRKIVGVMIRLFEPLIHLSLIFFTNPIIIPFSISHLLFIIILYGLPLFHIYKATQMKILSVSSNLNNTFSEILQGWRIIRDFKNYGLYREILCTNLSDIIKMRMIQLSVIKWASFRIQLFSGPLIIFLYLIYIFWSILLQKKNSESVNLVAIKFAYVIYFYITFTETLNLIFTKITSLEKDMCSLERVIEYSNKSFNENTKFEDFKLEDAILDEKMNNCGNLKLKFTNVELSYQMSDFTGNNNHLDFNAIKNFSLEFNPNEHIGIIGRTGRGKSTLIKGILGTVTPSHGKILFNEVEICNLSRRKRREMIGIVPQTPLRVKNWSIRKYLDPFFEHNQEKILQVLKLTGFYNIIADKVQVTNNLDLIEISDASHENGLFLTDSHLKYLNFVRIILNRKQYKIILLDEPTIEPQIKLKSEDLISSYEYPELIPIEKLIRDYFQHCCVVIVSHNLNTLKYCNRIINLNSYENMFKE